MVRWLIKSLWLNKGSVVTSSAGVAAAFVLVIALDAVFVGESTQIVGYIRHADADVWVMQRGVSNMHMATTFVWDWKARQVAELPGVERATPILYVNTVVKAGGRNWFAYVMGLQPNGARAGPWAMAAGKSLPAKGEIILPDVMADMAGVMIGDRAEIADKSFTVVGFSKETFSMANSIAFIEFSDLEELLSTSGTVSFILVDAAEGQDPEALAALIEQEVEKVSAIPQDRFISNDFQIAMLMGVEIVSFMTVIGSALAAIIIAFTIYSYVSRRRREFAIVKALGMKNSAVYLAVVLQAFIITALALAIAMFCSWLLLPALSTVLPQVTLVVTADAVLRMGVIALFVAVLAALVPAHLVSRVDPMTAFK